MQLCTTTDELRARDIRDRWEIKSPFFADINHSVVSYRVCGNGSECAADHAVFYLHGFGGSLDDTPFLEDHICNRTRLIRVANFGLQKIGLKLPLATFGDVCCIMHNSAQAVSTIATRMDLRSYDVVAHSWGGMVASINALRDQRCRKAMLLVSSPDICDVLEQMHSLHGLGFLGPLLDLGVGPMLRWEAVAAKFGKSWHQAAWEQINPFRLNGNPDIDMLIYNRNEDRVMQRWNVENYISHAKQRGINRVKAEFVTNSKLHFHDMPLTMFADRMKSFFFDETAT